MFDFKSFPARHTYPIPLLGIALMAIILGLDINEELFLYINSLSLYSGEWIWSVLTIFGGPLVILCIGLSFIHAQPKIALSIIPAIVLGSVLVFSLKWLFDIARPNLILEQSQFILIGMPPTSPAFPSGHTTGIFALATLIILNSKHYIISVFILIFATFVGLSRIMVGAHWPLDVAGGMIMGWGIGLTTTFFIQNWKLETKKQKMLSLCLLLCSILLIFRDTGYPNVYPILLTIGLYGIFISTKKLYTNIN